jgi:hypothetical protein
MESTTHGAQDMKTYELADGRVILTYDNGAFIPELCDRDFGLCPITDLVIEAIELPDFTTYEPDSIDMPSDLELSAIYGV